MNNLIPEEVLTQYEIGQIEKISPISIGLTHQTYKVTTSEGIYVMQKMHEMLGSDGIAQDFLVVTQYLEKKNFLAPSAVLTIDGEVLCKTDDGNWRLQTYIDGDTYDKIEDEEMAREAGRIYAEFHQAMNDIDYEFQTNIVMHESKKILKEFNQTVDEAAVELIEPVQAEIDFLNEELPKYFLPSGLPQRVIHADPKITNILFDKNKKAITIIDLDTVNRSNLLVELGDAFRSWCGLDEDDPKNKFRIDIYHAAWDEYQKHADFLTEQEIELAPRSAALIILELATRFLADYFNDSYFGWDEKQYKTRREHNLARARGQIAEYKDLARQISLG